MPSSRRGKLQVVAPPGEDMQKQRDDVTRQKRSSNKNDLPLFSRLSLVFLEHGARLVTPDVEHQKMMKDMADPRRVAGIHDTNHFPLDKGVVTAAVTVPVLHRDGYAVGRRTLTSAFCVVSKKQYQEIEQDLALAFVDDAHRFEATAIRLSTLYYPPLEGPLRNIENGVPTGRVLTTGAATLRSRRRPPAPKTK